MSLSLLALAVLALAGCANKQPSAGIADESGMRTEYKAESAAVKQNRLQESMARTFRSLAY